MSEAAELAVFQAKTPILVVLLIIAVQEIVPPPFQEQVQVGIAEKVPTGKLTI